MTSVAGDAGDLPSILLRYYPAASTLARFVAAKDRSAILRTDRAAFRAMHKFFPCVPQVVLSKDMLDKPQPLGGMSRRFVNVDVPEETISNAEYRTKAVEWMNRNRDYMSSSGTFTVASRGDMTLDENLQFMRDLTGKGQPVYNQSLPTVLSSPQNALQAVLSEHNQWTDHVSHTAVCPPVLTSHEIALVKGSPFANTRGYVDDETGTLPLRPKSITLCTFFPNDNHLMKLSEIDRGHLNEGVIRFAAKIRSEHEGSQLVLPGYDWGAGIGIPDDSRDFTDLLAREVSDKIDSMSATELASLLPNSQVSEADPASVIKARAALRQAIVFVSPGEHSRRVRAQMMRNPGAVVEVPPDDT